MRSLRWRLVAWYTGMAALVVLLIAALAHLAVSKIVSYGIAGSMENAAKQIPALVDQYEADPVPQTDLQEFLQQRLRPSGVIVLLGPLHPPLGFGMKPPPGTMMPAPPFTARLMGVEMHPMAVVFPGGSALVMPDAERLRTAMFQLWTIIAIFAAIVIFAAWRTAIVVAGNTLEPLVRTTHALNRFGDGDFTPEAVSTNDRSELGELARAYNRAVAQITHAFEERDRADAEMRQFVADAGHQLRTPLTVIVGYLSAMSARPDSGRRATAVSAMLAQSRRMRALIDDLITLARLEHGGARDRSIVEVNGVLRRVQESFPDDARTRLRVREAPPGTAVRADGGDLLSAVCALVDNALKYAPVGDVEIRASVDGDACTIAVEDRGPGMTADELAHAFDRFYRGASSEAVPGTGLGLSIIKKSIERAGGSIALHNREGGGLQCTVRLPSFPISSQRTAVS